MLTEEQEKKFFDLSLQAGIVFSPNSPVDEKDLFSGRKNQIRRIIDVIFQRGQHAIIFGERGVGKTSLANVLQEFLPRKESPVLAPRINCDSTDNFTSVWSKIFNKMNLTSTKKDMGYNKPALINPVKSDNFLKSEKGAPEQVLKSLIDLSDTFITIVIIDEFDRLSIEVRRLFSDLIKALSDHSVNATIILIGVGESVDDLIKEHQSVSRALMQIQMPRMTSTEIEEIIETGIERLEMTISKSTVEQIKILAKGFPYYAHLIGLHATRDALDNFSTHVNDDNLKCAIEKAIEDSQHSIKANYHNAIKSVKKDNLFSDVLLACALCEVNELGEFAAQDLREPMLKITNKNYGIPAYAQHLNEFSDKKRGNILIKSGQRKRFRYKFADPLMQPFILMHGIKEKKIA